MIPKELSFPATTIWLWYHPASLRILLDYRPALRQRTGVGEYAHQMATALARQAGTPDQIVLFSSSWKDRLSSDVVAGAEIVDARIPVSLLNFGWHRLEQPTVEALGGSADVTWSMHPLLMPASRAAQVVTVHDLFFLDHPEATVREIRRDYAELAAAHAQRADAVIAISEYTSAQAVARLGVPGDRISVCPPGAPSLTPRQEPATLGPILHVGTVEPRKNTAALVEAYSELAKGRESVPPLVFAGRADGAASSASPGVRYLGYVSDETKHTLYRDASMLVVPSLDEGFGIPALEAMSIGLPVVAAARGALPEVLGDAGLLIDASDPHQFVRGLSEAMGRLLDDVHLRRELRNRGIARAQTFSWDSSAARAREALVRAVARRKDRP